MEKKKSRRNDEKKVEVSPEGQQFTVGTHVKFSYNKHQFTGVVKKQLRNSAIIFFDPKFENTITAIDLKQRIVISYQKLKVIK